MTRIFVSLVAITLLAPGCSDSPDVTPSPAAETGATLDGALEADTPIGSDAADVSDTAVVTDAATDKTRTFKVDPGIRVANASNAAAGIDTTSGKTYLYYAASDGKQLVSISDDGLTFPAGTTYTTYKNDSRNTRMPDGTWRRYMYDQKVKAFVSTTSTDGITFVDEPGIRYTPTAADKDQIGIWDAFTDKKNNVVLLYLGALFTVNNARRAYSTDGGKTFAFTSDNPFGDIAAPKGTDHYVDQKVIQLLDGRFRVVCMMKGVLYSLISDDGESFKPEGAIVSPSDFTDRKVISLHDPVPVRLSDGRYRIYFAANTEDGVAADGGKLVHSDMLSATTL